ncbi:MAG: hypothetical protein GY697_14840, partial [Desulfobacterales bacterium]|nr:hypothetical protein [Desulfobacterales bacterium]
LVEGDETVIVTLDSTNNGLFSIDAGNNVDTVTIGDNDTATADLSVTTHGNETGSVDIVYTVTLSKQNDTGSAITFDLTDATTGSATSGLDYTAFGGAGVISVAAGATPGTFTVTVTDDALLEATETVDATLSKPSHAAVNIGTAIGSATCRDRESVSAVVSVINNRNETGSVDIVYTVTLSKQN